VASVFLPATLTRKQYVTRWLILFALVVAAMLLFVSAPTGTPMKIASIVFPIVVLLVFIYNIFGLSIPRLKNAQISLLALLLVFIPFGVLILFVICAMAREKA
jgi:tryptophan-rich sensory protein